MFFPAVAWDQLDHPRVPALPRALTPALPPGEPGEAQVGGEGTPLPPLVVSLPVARLFLLTLIKEDLGESSLLRAHTHFN